MASRNGLIFEQSRSTSSGLIRGIKVDNPEAWNRWVSDYSPLVYGWCRRAGLAPGEAADVMQEVFTAVWRGVDRFSRDKVGQTFRGWLRIITRNKITDHFRSKINLPIPLGGGDNFVTTPPRSLDSIESGAERRQLQWLFDQAMQRICHEFEPGTWQAFMCYTLQDRSAADIAEELGMTAGSVRQAKYKVLRRLRAELGDAEPFKTD